VIEDEVGLVGILVLVIGQCCQAAQVEAVIDPRLPVSQA
jgi:hypothetical protein